MKVPQEGSTLLSTHSPFSVGYLHRSGSSKSFNLSSKTDWCSTDLPDESNGSKRKIVLQPKKPISNKVSVVDCPKTAPPAVAPNCLFMNLSSRQLATLADQRLSTSLRVASTHAVVEYL